MFVHLTYYIGTYTGNIAVMCVSAHDKDIRNHAFYGRFCLIQTSVVLNPHKSISASVKLCHIQGSHNPQWITIWNVLWDIQKLLLTCSLHICSLLSWVYAAEIAAVMYSLAELIIKVFLNNTQGVCKWSALCKRDSYKRGENNTGRQ